MTTRPSMTSVEFFDLLRWIDGSPLRQHIEPYRRAIFTAVLDERDDDGRPRYNFALLGRAKKNWKSADLVPGAFWHPVGQVVAWQSMLSPGERRGSSW